MNLSFVWAAYRVYCSDYRKSQQYPFFNILLNSLSLWFLFMPPHTKQHEIKYIESRDREKFSSLKTNSSNLLLHIELTMKMMILSLSEQTKIFISSPTTLHAIFFLSIFFSLLLLVLFHSKCFVRSQTTTFFPLLRGFGTYVNE